MKARSSVNNFDLKSEVVKTVAKRVEDRVWKMMIFPFLGLGLLSICSWNCSAALQVYNEEVQLFDWDALQTDVEEFMDNHPTCSSNPWCFHNETQEEG